MVKPVLVFLCKLFLMKIAMLDIVQNASSYAKDLHL